MGRRVLIVDDHAEFRASARRLLESEGFEVVGEEASGTAALSAAARLRPDVVLLDVVLPDLDGFAVCELLTSADSATAVVLMSSREQSAYRWLVERGAARGFIPKADLTGSALADLAG